MVSVFKTVVFWTIFCIGAVCPILGGVLLIVCAALNIVDIEL